MHSLLWIAIFVSLVIWFANDLQSSANHLTRDQNIVIHGKSCIILYIFDDVAYL